MSKDVVTFYAELALNAGWIDYVRNQVQQMEKDPSGMWVGLGKAIAVRMKELNESISD
jgi:hypothetical protein